MLDLAPRLRHDSLLEQTKTREDIMHHQASQYISRDQWEWFGNAGHLCVADFCRFHLTTKVGSHLISTVGEYYPPSQINREKPENISGDFIYETMVFFIDGACPCGCGLPLHSGIDIICNKYNTPKEATDGHESTCERVARGEERNNSEGWGSSWLS